MKIMKLLTRAVPLLLVCVTSAKAAGAAEQELRNLLAEYDGFSAKFTQQVTDSEHNLLHQAKGELVFKQPGLFRWQVAQPEQELLLSNGETLWWYNPFLEQVSIYDAKQAVATTPFALLVSNQDSTWDKFNIVKVGQGYEVSPKVQEQSQVEKLTVTFENKVLQKIEILDRTQQLSAYALTEQAFTDNANRQFNFVIPDDVDVDDQRAAQ